jgi:hypothetical protein
LEGHGNFLYIYHEINEKQYLMWSNENYHNHSGDIKNH